MLGGLVDKPNGSLLAPGRPTEGMVFDKGPSKKTNSLKLFNVSIPSKLSTVETVLCDLQSDRKNMVT